MSVFNPRVKLSQLLSINIVLIFTSLDLFLGYKIYKVIELRQNIRGISITKVEGNKFSIDNTNLNFFYEPLPNNQFEWKPDWLNKHVSNPTNSDTFIERYEYSVSKKPDTFRIISIGDSFTQGVFVNISDSYPEQLEDLLNTKLKCKKINTFEVINMGVTGYDLRYTTERFYKRGLKYNPDLVLWFLHDWDFRIINELYLPLFKQLKESGVSEFERRNDGIILAKIGEEAIRKIDKQYGEQFVLDYQKDALNKLGEIYKGKLLIFSYSDLNENYNRIILKFVASNSNYFYDDRLINLAKDKRYIFPDTHPNEKGYKLIAGYIFNLLKNKYLVECNEK